MKPSLLSLFLLLILLSSTATAAELPPILQSGFVKYAKEGPKAAIEAWAKGSALEGSKEVQNQAVNFQKIQDFYGKYVGYDLIRSREFTPSGSLYLIEIRFEKGNVFAKFFLYRKAAGEQVVTTYNFHTNPENVWPAEVIFGGSDQK